MTGQPIVIVDEQGIEHEFPAGMDPKRAGAIVRSRTTGPQIEGSQEPVPVVSQFRDRAAREASQLPEEGQFTGQNPLAMAPIGGLGRVASGAAGRIGGALRTLGKTPLGAAIKAGVAATPIVGPMGRAALGAYRQAQAPVPWEGKGFPERGFIRSTPEARGPSASPTRSPAPPSGPVAPTAGVRPAPPPPPDVRVASPEDWARWDREMAIWKRLASERGTIYAGGGTP